MGWGTGRRAGSRCAPWLAFALAVTGCDDPVAPIISATELQRQQIYDAGEWLQRVPLQYAAGLYARVKLESFLDALELPEDLRARMNARLDAEDFVDELIPFLLFLREMYEPPEGENAEDFDQYLRAHFEPENGIPGFTHDLWTWENASAGNSSGLPNLPPDVARELVVLYDILFLHNPHAAGGLRERLTCETREGGAALEATTRRAMPAIRSLIGALRKQSKSGKDSEPESELGGALQGLLDDDSRLEAAAAAVIRFVDQTVCRNYRFFATRAFRAKQLTRWMRRELETPGGGALWRYLEHANRERRYGVMMVVDGLQGRLMEALAKGDADSPFVRAIVAEQQARGGPAPRARSLRAPDPQQTDFLTHFSRRGFTHPHYLPLFRGLLTDRKAAWIPVGVSTTPTISVRNIPIALTGAPVAGPHATGLPNFHFVDRQFEQAGEQQGRAYYFYGSDAVELVSLTQRAGLRTLAERLPHVGSLSCTAQYDEAFHFGIDALLNLGIGEHQRDFGDRMCAAELARRAATEVELKERRQELLSRRESLTEAHPWWKFWSRFGQSRELELAGRMIAEIARREQRAMPELLIYYNPWPDHFAHFEGPFADEILSPSGELNRLDYWLRRIESAYDAAGLQPRTVWGMAGDHGLSPVFHLLNPEVEVFDALREEGSDFRVVKISSDEGEGPKLTNPFDPPSMKGIDVVVASTAGGNYMLDLFRDQAANFAVQPLASELRALRPLASHTDAKRGDAPSEPTRGAGLDPPTEPGESASAGVDLLSEITTRLADSLDYLAVRDAPCDPERCVTRVMAMRGGLAAEGLLRRVGMRIHYAFQGADLLDTGTLSPYERLSDAARAEHQQLRTRCLAASVDEPETWCGEREWRRLTSYSVRPDSVVQLAHLYDSERAGSVNLFPRDGVGYNSQVPGRHAGESFHEKNAFVALWGSPLVPLEQRPPRRSAVNGSVPMAIFEWLSESQPVQGQDGWGFERLEGIVSADSASP